MDPVAGTQTGRVAIQQLREEGAGLVWKPEGLALVAEALEQELDGPDAGSAVEELLRLMVVLRDKRDAPDAADALAALLHEVPGASAVVRARFVRVGGIDHQRTFARREGREEPLCAPRADSRPPAGALALKDLLDPVTRGRARAPRMARGKDQHGTR